MVVVCSKRRTVQERADEEDRGRSFKINLCRRGSASIAAGSDRQQPTDRVQTATLRTKPWTVPKSPENRLNIIENRPKIVVKSFSDDQGGHNHPWTAFGTMLRTPKARLGRSKSALGTPRACQKSRARQRCSKKRLESSRDALGAHLSWRAPPKTLVDRFSKIFVTKF